MCMLMSWKYQTPVFQFHVCFIYLASKNSGSNLRSLGFTPTFRVRQLWVRWRDLAKYTLYIHPSIPLLYPLHSGLRGSFGAYPNCYRVKAGSHHGQVARIFTFILNAKNLLQTVLMEETLEVFLDPRNHSEFSEMEKFEAHGCKT